MTTATDLRNWTWTVSGTTELITETCITCGVLFALPTELQAHRTQNKLSFYCPNGHSMAYTESEADRLKRLLKNAESTAATERRWRETAERSLVATKGHVTRLRRRVLAGECPFCGQHLRDLERHVSRQHPNESAETTELSTS